MTAAPVAPDPDGYACYPSLRGRVVFVTGGATGIGAAFVAEFARQGARVGFVDLQQKPGEDLAAKLGAELGAEPWYRTCDVSDVPRLREAIAACAADLGPVDVLVNNAANDERRPVDEMTEEFWDAEFGVNLRPMFFASQAVAPAMRDHGRGSIINLGSITWRAGFANVAAYATAKAGIEGLTRALARELGEHGIRVACIVPGGVRTPRQSRLWHTPEEEARILAQQCLKIRVEPEDVAALALFLASDDARACTAHEYFVDAGWR